MIAISINRGTGLLKNVNNCQSRLSKYHGRSKKRPYSNAADVLYDSTFVTDNDTQAHLLSLAPGAPQ